VDQHRIHLDRNHALGARQQFFGQRALARTDFDRERRRIRACRGSDFFKDGFAGEEMLPETPAQRP
jgi:hypothetical protein